MRYFCFVMVFVAALNIAACRAREYSSTPSSGTWGSQVGGTLRSEDFSYISCANFEKAIFFRVSKNAGLGITHEYFGISVSYRNKLSSRIEQKHYVTGLNASDDQKFFEQHVKGDVCLASTRSYEFKDCADFEKARTKVVAAMNSSAYNSKAIFILSMVGRPILGQPCSNVTNNIEKILTE